ncbi:MAG: DUF2085 domain-containing protein [Proteobacteria bacterium]|nr:DUF2085 domain-containing protein [Pseudomonadota bacterium]
MRPEAPRRLLCVLGLTHASDASVARCLHLPVGPWRVAVCARCAALYSALLLIVALQLALRARLGPQPLPDAALALGGAAPALLDWGSARLGGRSGRGRRLWTGGLLGLALGRTLFLHWRDPPGELLAIQLALLLTGGATVERLRRRRRERDAPQGRD